MNKLTYLFAAFGFFVFTACGGGNSEEAATEVVVCANTGEPCLEDHSCCVVKEEAEDSTSAEDHDHSDGTEHDHDHSDGGDHDHEH